MSRKVNIYCVEGGQINEHEVFETSVHPTALHSKPVKLWK